MPLPRSVLRMSSAELEAFLTSERTARVATVSSSGEPHVVPLWFVWLGGVLYMTSLRRSRRNADIESGSRVAVCVDAGREYGELKGVVLYGRFEDAAGDPQAEDARRMFGEKYWNGMVVPEVRSHRWLRLRPDRVVSWDFAKIPAGRDRRTQSS